jgi:Domain of unknown function (DU1801)
MSKLAVIKTKQTSSSVEDFIEAIADEEKRKDTQIILKLMKKAVKEEPRIWGSSMIGFGLVRYKSPATGREVDWFKIGFSPRKSNFSLHLVMDIKKQADLLSKLGKHKTGMGCLYINKLADIDLKVLEQLIKVAVMK